MRRLVLCICLMFAPRMAFCDSPVQNNAPDQANDKVQDNLQSILSSDPILDGADVQVQVNDQSITLTGTVQSYAQHQRALQLVQPYASSRKIIDKIRVPNSQTKYAISRLSAI